MVEGGCAGGQARCAAGCAGWVGLEEVCEGGYDLVRLDLVEFVVWWDVGAVGAAEDAGVGDAEGEPFDGFLPGRTDDDHGDAYGAAYVHGSGVEGDGGVAEGEESGELGDGGFAGEGGSYASGGLADLLDGDGVGGGAYVDDGATEGVVGVADDLDETVGVPTGALAAAVLGDEDDQGLAFGVGCGCEGFDGGDVGGGEEDFWFVVSLGAVGEAG